MQANLFEKPVNVGKSSVEYASVKSILTRASGFMSTYDYTLNPYSGCTFGCTYCYAAFFVRDKLKQDEWGRWVKVKENALQLMIKKRKRPIVGKTIYMSSVTDPYQPIEKKLQLTRGLLHELATYHKPRLFVQTRSPLVTRDIDLFKEIGDVQVNMTITTDSEEVRMAFEPMCPSNKVRLKAIKEIHEAGIAACITLTPLLPVINPHDFARDLVATGISRFIIQPFHVTKGKFVAGTRKQALELVHKLGWNRERYQEVLEIIKAYIPTIGEGKEGFDPAARYEGRAGNMDSGTASNA